MIGAATICPDESVVDESLAILCKGEYVCDERKVEKHVPVENEGTGGEISKSRDGGATKGVHSGCNGFINESFGLSGCRRGLEIDERTDDLCNRCV